MTPDTRLVLVRHARTEHPELCHGARSDPSLSAHGRREAHGLAARLRALAAELGSIDAIVTSPAQRALETAAELAVEFSLRPRVDARWRERDFGAWEGRAWSELWEQVPAEVLRDGGSWAAFTPPDAESARAVRRRVRPALDESLAARGTTVVVSHAGPIRAALGTALGIDDATTWQLDVANARALVLEGIQGAVRLTRLGA